MQVRAGIVIDTHVWIWLVSEPRRLSKRAAAAISRAEIVGVSAISAWEIATKVALGRIELDRDVDVWVRQASAIDRVESISVDTAIAVMAGTLGAEGLRGDPADRLIAATALFHHAPLVTKDTRLRSFERLRTIW